MAWTLLRSFPEEEQAMHVFWLQQVPNALPNTPQPLVWADKVNVELPKYWHLCPQQLRRFYAAVLTIDAVRPKLTYSKTLLVDVDLYRFAKEGLAFKSLNSYSYGDQGAKLRNLQNHSRDIKLLQERFPDHCADLVQNSLDAAIVDRSRRTPFFDALQGSYNSDMIRWNELRKNMGQQNGYGVNWTWLLCLAALVMFWGGLDWVIGLVLSLVRNPFLVLAFAFACYTFFGNQPASTLPYPHVTEELLHAIPITVISMTASLFGTIQTHPGYHLFFALAAMIYGYYFRKWLIDRELGLTKGLHVLNGVLLSAFGPPAIPFVIAIHYYYNWKAARDNSRFVAWVNDFYNTPWASRPTVRNSIISLTPTGGLTPLRRVTKACVTIPPQNERLELVHTKDMVTKEAGVFWVYLPHGTPGYVAQQCDRVLHAALLCRVLKQPPQYVPRNCARLWDMASGLLSAALGSHCEGVLSWDNGLPKFLENAKSSNAKFKRMLRALDTLASCGAHELDRKHRSVKVIVKADELSFRYDQITHTPEFKPRVIHNVDPLVQAEIGPYMVQISEIMKKIFCFDHTEIRLLRQGRRFVIKHSYASGRSDLWLSREFCKAWEWVKDKQCPPDEWRVWIAEGGDDCIGIDCNGVFYSDISAMDMCENVYCLRAQHRIFKRMGMPSDKCDSLMAISNAKLVAPFGVVDLKGNPQRNTGSPDTTGGNTVVTMMLMTALVIFDFDQEIMTQMGFELKFHRADGPWDYEFLKGLFYPSDGDLPFWWAPMPSRVLKVGKNYKDPRILTRVRDPEEACRIMASAQAASYACFAEVPLLRIWVRKWHRVGSSRVEARRPWQIQASGKPQEINMQESISILAKRYSVNPTDIYTLEALLEKQEMFQFIEHPLYLEMALRDY
jgi:hypothetical protein